MGGAGGWRDGFGVIGGAGGALGSFLCGGAARWEKDSGGSAEVPLPLLPEPSEPPGAVGINLALSCDKELTLQSGGFVAWLG